VTYLGVEEYAILDLLVDLDGEIVFQCSSFALVSSRKGDFNVGFHVGKRQIWQAESFKIEVQYPLYVILLEQLL
jgi:hypothetical protein